MPGPFGRVERRGTPAEFLVLGLGNPGPEYDGTRHNVGAEVVTRLAARCGQTLKKGRERALSAEVALAGHRVALAVPVTHMNLSGESAVLLVKRHGIERPEQVVVVHDELDLPTGTVRVKAGGGLAGHNGLRSVKQHLHSDAFLRVRIGIDRPPGRQDPADYVLRRPGKAEREALDTAVEVACDAVEAIAARGVDAAMNEFNGR